METIDNIIAEMRGLALVDEESDEMVARKLHRWQMFPLAKAGGCKKRLAMCRQKQMRQIL